VNGPFDSRAKGVVEAVAAVAPTDLNQLASEPYMAYLKSKLGKWHSEAPRPARKQPAVDEDERASRQRQGGGNRDRRSLWWRRRRWVCSRLVKRFNPNSTYGEHRSERRTGTAQCLGCIARIWKQTAIESHSVPDYSVECCLQWTVSCTKVIMLKRNESRSECRPGSGAQRAE
jgi:hypothetical protein